MICTVSTQSDIHVHQSEKTAAFTESLYGHVNCKVSDNIVGEKLKLVNSFLVHELRWLQKWNEWSSNSHRPVSCNILVYLNGNIKSLMK